MEKYLWECKKQNKEVTFEECEVCPDCGPITDLENGRHRICRYENRKIEWKFRTWLIEKELKNKMKQAENTVREE